MYRIFIEVKGRGGRRISNQAEERSRLNRIASRDITCATPCIIDKVSPPHHQSTATLRIGHCMI